MTNKPKSGTQAALDHLNDILNDPVKLEEFLEKYDAECVINDNRLICSVVDPSYRKATLGDMISYGMNSNYYDDLQREAVDLFYQYHGKGD